MSYRVRYTMPDGRTGRWTRDYATREEAQRAIDGRVYDTGFAHFVEEVPDVPPKPKSTSTTERLVRLLHDRHARGLAEYGTTLDRTDLAPEEWAQHAIDEALDLAGYLMRVKDWFAPEPGSTAAHHVEILRARVKELEEELAKAKASLAKAPSVPVGASEAPGEGGDSNRRRLEALERWLRLKEDVSIVWMENRCLALNETGLAVDWGWSLAALADKLTEKEDKP